MTTLVVRNGVRQEAGRDRFGDGDPYMPAGEPAQAVDLCLELPQLLERTAHVHQKELARGGRSDAARQAGVQ